MSLEIFFMGLREQGASLALALSQAEIDSQHRGYDSDREAARAAQEAGGVEGLVLNPYEGAQSADLIVVSTPASEAAEFLQRITPNLKAEAVVLDCSPLKSDNLEWARQHFPEGNEYIGAFPILPHKELSMRGSSFQRAKADHYAGSSLALVIPPEASQRAVQLALTVAEAIGADPFFIEATELDVIESLSDTLPRLLGAALLRFAARSEGWSNVERAAGRTLVESTRTVVDQDPKRWSEELLANREIIRIHLREMIETLEEFSRLLQENEPEPLQKALQQAQEARLGWLAARKEADWMGQELAPTYREETDLLGRLMGRRRGSDEEG